MKSILNNQHTEQRDLALSWNGGEFTDAELARVANGIDAEDMVPVTVEVLRNSFAIIGMYALNGENRELVGFARHLKRIFHNFDSKYKTDEMAFVELGSVWVSPERRGQGIGHEIIRESSEFVRGCGFLPVAVCNDQSRKVFESAGFEPIAEMENSQGLPRIIEVDREVPFGMSRLCRAVAISKIREIDRFETCNLLF